MMKPSVCLTKGLRSREHLSAIFAAFVLVVSGCPRLFSQVAHPPITIDAGNPAAFASYDGATVLSGIGFSDGWQRHVEPLPLVIEIRSLEKVDDKAALAHFVLHNVGSVTYELPAHQEQKKTFSFGSSGRKSLAFWVVPPSSESGITNKGHVFVVLNSAKSDRSSYIALRPGDAQEITVRCNSVQLPLTVGAAMSIVAEETRYGDDDPHVKADPHKLVVAEQTPPIFSTNVEKVR